jgi:chemotaxis protein methyltransferase CheR
VKSGFPSNELERLERTMSEQLGFAFEAERLEQLEHAARARQAELGLANLDAYVARLGSPAFRAEEVARLAETLTVTETFFFRNADQIQAFVEAVLPERTRHGGRRLRILSAGCASGEEPYSLAIALCEAMPELETWDLQILGVDVNRAMLAKAERASYTPWSLRGTPDAIRNRYFKQTGGTLELDPVIRRMVTFRDQNLAENDPLFFRALACDVIFCRNVIMYFTPETMARVVSRLTDALLPGGFLFLGHAETLRGLSHEYHLCHTHNTFYYQRREPGMPASARFKASQPPLAPELAALPAVVEDATSWFEAIQRATRRVNELTRESASRPPITAVAAGERRPVPGTSELASVLELMRRERFAEARARIEALPPDAGKHPDALLFSAVLFTNCSRPTSFMRALTI